MERLETADARVSQLEGQAGELDGELATLEKRRDEAFAAIDGEAPANATPAPTRLRGSRATCCPSTRRSAMRRAASGRPGSTSTAAGVPARAHPDGAWADEGGRRRRRPAVRGVRARSWSAPPTPGCDAAPMARRRGRRRLTRQSRAGGYGAVVKDASTGEVLAERERSIGGATNNVAEYSGLIAGLRAAARIDAGADVEVRMDSKLVVEQMSGRWQIKHPDMRPLAAEAGRGERLRRVRYTWVPREQNTHADRLANQAMDAAAAGRSWSPRPSSGAGGTVLPGSRSSAAAAPRASVPQPDGEPVTLVIARHGRTADTERGVFAGARRRRPPAVDRRRGGRRPPRGGAQPARHRRFTRAGGSPVRAVVTSPMLRAQRTATVVADRLGLDVGVDEGWAEMRFGAWEGLTYAEIMRRDPQALGAWWGDATVAPPDGESFDALALRVRAARERAVAAHPGESVAVLSHGGPVRVLVRDALEGGPAVLWRLRVAPCALTVIRYWPDGGLEVVTVNATPV